MLLLIFYEIIGNVEINGFFPMHSISCSYFFFSLAFLITKISHFLIVSFCFDQLVAYRVYYLSTCILKRLDNNGFVFWQCKVLLHSLIISYVL